MPTDSNRLAKLLNDYIAGPEMLRHAVAGMSREQLLARPIPGKWSTHEVVCHLADCEILYADKERCPHWLLEVKRKIRGS